MVSKLVLVWGGKRVFFFLCVGSKLMGKSQDYEATETFIERACSAEGEVC